MTQNAPRWVGRSGRLTEPGLARAIRRGAYHRPGGLATFACLQVEERFFDRVKEDVLRLVEREPSIDTRTGKLAYLRPKGGVSYHSLLTVNGDLQDTGAAWSKTFVGKAFHQADTYPALGEFIHAFPEAMNVTIRGLSQSSSIAPHEERDIHQLNEITYARIRLHLPIITTPGARVMLEGRYYHFTPGKVYYFNNGCVHFAENPGASPRLHLIWDLFLTSELFRDVFDQGGSDVRAPFFRKIGRYDDTGDVGPCRVQAYQFTSRLGKLPDWTQPWVWNNLLRVAEFYAGKDRRVAIYPQEEFQRRLQPAEGPVPVLAPVPA